MENEIKVFNSYEDLIKEPGIQRVPERDHLKLWAHSALANALEQSKYIVIYTKTGAPMQVIWATQDNTFNCKHYELNYRKMPRQDLIKPVMRAACKAMLCRQKDLVFVDNREDE
ncbi:hypothetical protein pEaSNUABM9_00268 [Erwinia phage pEa_SNUABM_9]|nr:hypothetical protein pEaSNUABM9_00268 [Erwinia phage pEa_SNUABM_9]